MSWPSNRIWPVVGWESPHTRLTVVLLPEPLGPIRPNTSPGRIEKSMPSTARTPPKYLERPRISSTALLAVELLAAEEAREPPRRRGIDQAVRAQIHGQHDQR